MPPPPVPRPPYARPTSSSPTWRPSPSRCAPTVPARWPPPVVEPVRRAVVTFGLHLCGLDMRQNAAVHEVVVAELLAVAGVCGDYLERDEPGRLAVLRAELTSPRPLRSPFAAYSERTAGELDVLDAAAVAVGRLGANAIPHYVISGAESASDVLEVAVLLRECGLVRPGQSPPSSIDIVPLFETIGDLQRGHEVLAALLDDPCYAHARRRPRWSPGGDGRLLRLEQGRRLHDRQLGPVRGPVAPRRGGPRARRAAAAVPRARRHGRARRRAGVRGHPGPAARFRRRPAAHHGAGRDGRRQVQPAAGGAAQPRDPRRCHARGVSRHGIPAGRRRGTVRGGDGDPRRICVRRLSGPRPRGAAVRRVLHARSRRSARSPR